ncbi:hypothetical protein ACQE98_16220 [Ornithinimicrobium sp. W1679]|uniref:hypothetical protein n=1 Tax=Ornithinimicrobium sp. W1679 TaxID=3418770 RepID=UPI003CF21E49
MNPAVDVTHTVKVRPDDLLNVPGQDGRQVRLVHKPHTDVTIDAIELGAQGNGQELLVDPRLDHPAQLARPSLVVPEGLPHVRGTS